MRDAVTRFVVSLATGRRGLNEEGGDDGGGGADGGADAARAIAEAEHRLTGFNGMLLSLILVLLIVSGVWSDRHKFPASSSSILIGAALGAIFRIVGEQESHMLSSAAGVKFDEELFLFVMLPPIIYEAGYSLPRRPFFQNFMTIFLFAIVGTLLTTFVIGKTVYSVGSTGVFASPSGQVDALDFTTPLDSYLFGALISATDPVATLAIMGAVNADPVIYTIIFGESVLNDAVAIVLVRIIEEMGSDGFGDTVHYFVGVLKFFEVAVGSLVVGVVVAALSALLMKRVDITHHPSFELALVILFGYASYSTAECLGFSGILSLFTCGVIAGHYHKSSLSPAARAATGVSLQTMAHLAETAVFAYMGVDLFASKGAGYDAFSASGHGVNVTADGDAAAGLVFERANLVGFVFFCLAVVLLARVVVVLPLCFFANTFRGAHRKLSGRAMAMLVFAGLRGAIAFALAHNVHSPHQQQIAAATTTVVMATVFVLGGTTRTVLRKLKMQAPPRPPGQGMLEDTPHRSDEDGFSSEGDRRGVLNRYQYLDKRYLMPLFGGGPASNRRGRAGVEPTSTHSAAGGASGMVADGYNQSSDDRSEVSEASADEVTRRAVAVEMVGLQPGGDADSSTVTRA